ncbi:MAG: hypothetical protein GY798_30620 [Hyphomicrobiales bacterium]|nr:hypothetical protein [Hyphomicrobiales bacterium]
MTGAFVAELAGGYIDSTSGRNLVYWIEVAVEESFEMIGLVLLIGAVLHYLPLIAPRTVVAFRS